MSKPGSGLDKPVKNAPKYPPKGNARLTDVPCKACGRPLTVACVTNREPWCSKACAGLPDLAPGQDVADAELAEVES